MYTVFPDAYTAHPSGHDGYLQEILLQSIHSWECLVKSCDSAPWKWSKR